MKLHTFLSIVFNFLVICVNAQNHYQPTGNFTDAMNINLLAAKVNGVDLEAGDEIGIFSDDLCVGHAVLDKSLEGVFDALTKSAVAGADDIETAEVDGFSTGATIVYKFWDASENAEIAVSEIKYYNPNNGSEISPRTFAIGATAYVSLNTTYNYTPKSNAGPDQILHEGESGQLDGTGSVDLNQDSLSFIWEDLDGFGLSELNVSTPQFTAPKVDSDKDFRFVLFVSDGLSESEDTTVVSVLNVVSGPVANADTDVIEVIEAETVNLDGSNSFDPEGEQISWNWELSMSGIELMNSDSANASFIAPLVQADTTIYAHLTVTNTSGLSDRDTVQVNILNLNASPVAIVTIKNIEISEGDSVVLDGSSSYDPDDGPSVLSYQWNSLNGGELDGAAATNPVFKAPYLLANSVFLFTLIVFDGENYSSPDTVAVTVVHENLAPVAIAGEDLVVDEGAEVQLDGSFSFDPEGDTIRFEWYSDYLVFDDPNSPIPGFRAPEQQQDTTVFVTLRVSDSELWSIPDTLAITIKQVNKAPEWISVPMDTAYLGMSYQGLIEAFDADKYDTLRFSYADLPSWLTFTDNGDGTAELSTDTIPYIDAFQGLWEFAIQVSDGSVIADTTITLFVTFYTDINQMNLSAFKVFPNPASDWLHIQFENNSPENRIMRFYTSNGILVKQKAIPFGKSEIDISSFRKGVYFLEVLEERKRLGSYKIVIN